MSLKPLANFMINNKGEIPYVNLRAQWAKESSILLPIIENTLESGHYVGGEEVEKFEKKIAEYCNVKYAVATNSGTDALILALRLLEINPGDEVITPPNSFVASTAAIVHLGAKPVFVDVLPDQNIDTKLIKSRITRNTKAIMPVHLTGRMADMKSIMSLAEAYKIPVVEDSAQAIGSRYNGKYSGSIGKIGCFSTHPLKNLNACGDGGFITTDDECIYERGKSLRNHGLLDRNTVNEFGFVSRMDVLQAAILNYRLSQLESMIEIRRRNANFYMNNLDPDFVFFPKEKPWEHNTYHTFVIQVNQRAKLISELEKFGIQTAIHYPTPIHLQPAAKKLGYKLGDFPVAEKQSEAILTLPVHQFLSESDLQKIVHVTNNFFQNT